MTKAARQTRKVCGNCCYHNTYEYPGKVFCFVRFSDRKDSAVSILFSCDEWEPRLQECLCLEDYIKQKKGAERGAASKRVMKKRS